MTCPKCKAKTRVVDSRDIRREINDTERNGYPCVNKATECDYSEGIARTRVCKCGYRFHTIETCLTEAEAGA